MNGAWRKRSIQGREEKTKSMARIEELERVRRHRRTIVDVECDDPCVIRRLWSTDELPLRTHPKGEKAKENHSDLHCAQDTTRNVGSSGTRRVPNIFWVV